MNPSDPLIQISLERTDPSHRQVSIDGIALARAEKLVAGLLIKRRCGYVMWCKCKVLIVGRYEPGLTHIKLLFYAFGSLTF